jgi:O-antigen/teichoic acid export membrane protein
MNVSPAVWPVLQTLSKQGVAYFAFLALSLVLEPKDFGVLGMAATWIGFINVFAEIGFGAALIQRNEIHDGHLNTIFFVNFTIGLILTLAGVGASQIAAWFFNTPEVHPVLAVLSLGFFINSLSLTQLAYLQRKMQFKSLAIRDLIASISGALVAIAFALKGFGVWSLVAQSLAIYAVSTVLIWFYSDWKPGVKGASLTQLRVLWPYSCKIFQFNIFKYFAQNTDKVLVGYFLDSTALGYYTFAFRVAVFPFTTFVGAIGVYLFSKFSRMQSDVLSIKDDFLLLMKKLNSVICPILIVLAFWAHAYVPLIFGERWRPALEIFPVMVLVAFLQTNISPIGNIMKALDKPGWLLNWSILITGLVFLSMFFGARLGLYGIALGLAAAYLIGLFINYYILKKLVNFDLKDGLNLSQFVVIPITLTYALIEAGKMVLNIYLLPVSFLFFFAISAIFIANYLFRKG